MLIPFFRLKRNFDFTHENKNKPLNFCLFRRDRVTDVDTHMKCFQESDDPDDQITSLRELVELGARDEALSLLDASDPSEDSDSEYLTWVEGYSLVSETTKAQSIAIKTAEQTQSFVYCLALAWSLHSGTSEAERDAEYLSTMNQLFERSLELLNRYGLRDPIPLDVEEEDHYYAEIVSMIQKTTRDSAMIERALTAGVDLSTVYGGGQPCHFFTVVPPGDRIKYFKMYLDQCGLSDPEDLKRLLFVAMSAGHYSVTRDLILSRLKDEFDDDEVIPQSLLDQINEVL
jgi:hypothetical protein